MVANISFNPNITTVAGGTFGIDWDGLVQGNAMADPATRFALASGLLSMSETLPMWGGVGISELVSVAQGSPPMTPNPALGGYVSRATNISAVGAVASLTGFSVFDQAYGMINMPQSQVPQAASGQQVEFYRLGSGARIAVQMSPGLINAAGQIITQQVSWDFVNQMLISFAAAYTAATISGATWSNTGGGQTSFTVNEDFTTLLNAGDVINVSGVVSTPADVFNGQWVVKSVTDATHVVVTQLATVSPGTYGSGGTIPAGGGALPCKILQVKANNNMTVIYDPTTGFLNWNRNGAAALIQI